MNCISLSSLFSEQAPDAYYRLLRLKKIHGYHLVLVFSFKLLFSNIQALHAESLNYLLFETEPIPLEPASVPVREDPLPDFERLAGLQSDLEQLIITEGEFSPAQAPVLVQVASIKARWGDQSEALADLERALYLNRVEHGLNYPGNIPITRQMIDSHLALGEISEAVNMQRHLLSLLNSPGINADQKVRHYIDLADWNLSVFRQVLNAPVEPVISFNTSAPDSRRMAFGNLMQARSLYAQAIREISHSNAASSALFLELEKRLMETVFLSAYRRSLMEDHNFYYSIRYPVNASRISRRPVNRYSPVYKFGRDTWGSLLNYDFNNRAISSDKLINSLLMKADWELLFENRRKAIDQYSMLYAYLAREVEIDESLLQTYFAPEQPVRLPAFTPLPHSRGALGIDENDTVDYRGYIEVSYNMDRYGNTRNLKVTDSSENATRDIIGRLRKILVNYPARPRVLNGQVTAAEGITERYFFAFVEPD